MRHSLSMMAVLILTLLSGCAGPEDELPALDVPAGWKAENPTGTAWPDATWWRTFRSAQLDRLIRTAQQANYDIGAAAARVLEADAQARIAGAPLLPSLDGSGKASRSVSTEVQVRNPNGTTSGFRSTTHEFTAGLSVSYEVDLWGKNRAALGSAKALALASRYDRDAVALTVTADTAITYIQAIELQDRLKVAHDNFVNASQVLDLVITRERAGADTGLEVAQQRTLVAQQTAAIATIEQQRQQTETALSLLLGEPPQRLSLIPEPLDDLAIPVVGAGLPSALLERRPDIQRADAQLTAARLSVKVAKAALFPSIKLTGEDGFKSAEMANLLDPANSLYTLASSLTAPIFEGGTLRGEVELNQAEYEELTKDYTKSVLAAFGDVEDALIAIQQTELSYQAQKEVLAESLTAYRLSRAKYQAGAIRLLEVLDAQRSYFAARDQLIQVKSQRLQAAVALYKALGGGWDGSRNAQSRP